MLTFEKVLAAFKDYLEEDDRYTILMTPRGYTIMEWDTSPAKLGGRRVLCHTGADERPPAGGPRMLPGI